MDDVVPRPVRVGKNMVGAFDGAVDLAVVAGACGGEELGKVDKVQVVNRDNRAKSAPKGRDKVGAVEQRQPLAQQFGRQRAALKAVMAGRPEPGLAHRVGQLERRRLAAMKDP